LVERQPSKLNVASSNLVSRSVFISDFWGPNPKNWRLEGLAPTGWISFCFAHLAQLVEHVLGKDEVTSSILVVGSKRLCIQAALSLNALCGVGVTTESATN
jgi:hypothetical protein